MMNECFFYCAPIRSFSTWGIYALASYHFNVFDTIFKINLTCLFKTE